QRGASNSARTAAQADSPVPLSRCPAPDVGPTETRGETSMVRTALLSAVAAIGLTAATADAHPPVVVHRRVAVNYCPPPAPVCRSWNVMYRSCAAEPWRWYGTFDSAYRADHAAFHLRHRGAEVFVSVRG